MDALASRPAAMTPDQALAMLGKVISRASFYAAINRNQVPHLRLGKRILIPRYAFERWLESAGSKATAAN
jgi:excisionase family DNA binding protein